MADHSIDLAQAETDFHDRLYPSLTIPDGSRYNGYTPPRGDGVSGWGIQPSIYARLYQMKGRSVNTQWTT